MKNLITSIILTTAIAFLEGCVAAPAREPHEANYPTTGDTAILVASTAAGAVGGHAINSRYGAEAGGVAGLGLGLLVNKFKNDHEKALWSEAYEAGRRAGRLEVIQKFRSSQTLVQDGAAVQGAPVIHYDQGTVNGVRYAAHESTSPALEEPPR